MTKTITCCDGCGKELKCNSEKYYLDLRTDKYWVVEKEFQEKNLVFCEYCASDIKDSLKRIADMKCCW